MPASDDYHCLCDDLAAEHAALDAIVAPLSESQWSMLTPAEGWTIRDTIVHLALATVRMWWTRSACNVPTRPA